MRSASSDATVRSRIRSTLADVAIGGDGSVLTGDGGGAYLHPVTLYG
jgi:hypothetical protein